MAQDPDWKIAQQKVANAMKAFETVRKDFIGKAFTDTYAARGNLVKAQPSDFWFLYKGDYTLMEVKSSHYADKFYFKDVQPSQWAGARRVTAAGGQSIFVLAKLPLWQWFIVDGRVMVEHKLAGEAGLKWSEMTPLKLIMEDILCKTSQFYSLN